MYAVVVAVQEPVFAHFSHNLQTLQVKLQCMSVYRSVCVCVYVQALHLHHSYMDFALLSKRWVAWLAMCVHVQ